MWSSSEIRAIGVGFDPLHPLSCLVHAGRGFFVCRHPVAVATLVGTHVVGIRGRLTGAIGVSRMREAFLRRGGRSGAVRFIVAVCVILTVGGSASAAPRYDVGDYGVFGLPLSDFWHFNSFGQTL